MSDMTLLEKEEDIEKATKALKAMAHQRVFLSLKVANALKQVTTMGRVLIGICVPIRKIG